jgi:hypothetical protein
VHTHAGSETFYVLTGRGALDLAGARPARVVNRIADRSRRDCALRVDQQKPFFLRRWVGPIRIWTGHSRSTHQTPMHTVFVGWFGRSGNVNRALADLVSRRKNPSLCGLIWTPPDCGLSMSGRLVMAFCSPAERRRSAASPTTRGSASG